MGMFDYIRCQLPLPIGQNWKYQTKDTDRQGLMEHTITQEGRLILHYFEYEPTPEDELPYAEELKTIASDDPKRGWYQIIGSIRKCKGTDRDIDQNFDGDIIFYPDGEYVGQEKEAIGDNHLDYRATFRNGSCTEICQSIGKWDEPRDWKQVWRG